MSTIVGVFPISYAKVRDKIYPIFVVVGKVSAVKSMAAHKGAEILHTALKVYKA